MTNNKDSVELGRKLKNAREEKGLSIPQVATDLNLLDAYIKGLESGDHTSIKSDVFVRGYLRTYGNYLKLNVPELLTQYEAQTKLTDFVEDQDEDSSGNAIYVLMAIIVIGLLCWILWPSGDLDLVVSKENLVSQVAVENNVGVIDVEQAKDNASASPSLEALSLTIDTPIIDNASISNTPGNELLLRFVEECWVEVRDKTGRLLLADLKNAGDEVTLVGEPPFKAVIGNTAAVEVFYAGKAIDVLGNGESNTAKLVIGE
jgi:cytoskeleton protein RodZ